jgi:hypothetical protein
VIKLSPEQTRAFDNLTTTNGVNRVLYGGQAGGGKSFLISLWIIYMSQTYPETRYYFARRVLKDLKNSLLVTFFDVAKITDTRIRFHNQTKIDLPNGCNLDLIECEDLPGDPNFDRLGSKEYTAGAIEEGIDVKRRAADVLASRTRYKHDIYCHRCAHKESIPKDGHICPKCGTFTEGLERKQLITCNPGQSWIKDDIVDPFKKGTLESNVVFIPATLKSNPNERFAQSYQKTLKDLPAFERARLLHGDWEARPITGGEFWKDFDPNLHVKQIKYNQSLPIHLSFDENVHPYLTCTVWQVFKYMKRNEEFIEVRQIDEILMKDPRNTRKHMCREIENRYRSHEAGVFIYGDATSKKEDTAKEKGENFFTDIMKGLKSFNPIKRVPAANPSVMQSGQFINFLYERQSEGNPYKNIEIFISDKCRTSINDYQYVLEDVDGTIKKVKEKNPDTGVTYERDGHISDSKRYFFVKVFQEDYNKFRRGGINPSYEYGNKEPWYNG